jgi:hypothetical protein
VWTELTQSKTGTNDRLVLKVKSLYIAQEAECTLASTRTLVHVVVY